jgi:hypothetical protein
MSLSKTRPRQLIDVNAKANSAGRLPGLDVDIQDSWPLIKASEATLYAIRAILDSAIDFALSWAIYYRLREYLPRILISVGKDVV